MNSLDWIVIAAYLVGMVVFSWYVGRGQQDQEDYYVGGRRLPWWAVGISTMATQASAVGFVSVPAFVGLRPGGGLSWLLFELAVPLAMVVVTVLLIPFFRSLKLVSVYEYIERRFDRRTRLILAGAFLVSRGLSAGAILYASALVLSVCLQTDLHLMLVVVGGVTVVYDVIGGMRAVVYSDVLQMLILVAGIALCVAYGVGEVGGWRAVLDAHEPSRLTVVNLGWGWNDGEQFPLWAFVFGGIFLYASYYGCDQSQAQRELSAASVQQSRYALVFNGFARLPLTLAYMGMGLAIGAVFRSDPAAQQLLVGENVDYMVPTFVLHYVPHGLKALIFAAVLAAAMSSLDSAINSLSATTMRDFIEPHVQTLGPKQHLRMSRIATAIWGMLVIGSALFLGGDKTLAETVNMIGSAFYGPILGAFVTGVCSRSVPGRAMMVGVLAGVACNVTLWLGFPQLFWMWWNAAGCVVAVGVALSATVLLGENAPKAADGLVVWQGPTWSKERRWIPVYVALALYSAAMLALCAVLPTWLRGTEVR